MMRTITSGAVVTRDENSGDIRLLLLVPNHQGIVLFDLAPAQHHLALTNHPGVSMEAAGFTFIVVTVISIIFFVFGDANLHLRRKAGMREQRLSGDRLGETGSSGQVASHDPYRPYYLLHRATRRSGGRSGHRSASGLHRKNPERSPSHADHEQNAHQDAS